MKNNLVLFFLFLISSVASAGIKKNFIVTKVFFDVEHNYYKVHFENQAGVYKADGKLYNCLAESLAKSKEVKIEFEAMGLKLTSCSKVSTK